MGITLSQLKDRIFEKMGGAPGMFNIEISDNQFQYIVDDVTDEYVDRHFDGTTPEIYILTLTEGTYEYILPNYVKNVIGYYATTSQSYPSLRKLIYEYNPQIITTDLISFVAFDSFLKTTNLIMGISHDFNYNSTLKLFQIKNLEGLSSIALQIRKDISINNYEDMYADPFFQKYVLALSLIQWARNLKKIDRPLLGNETINWREIEQDGKDLLDEVKEELKKDEIEPIGIYFG